MAAVRWPMPLSLFGGTLNNSAQLCTSTEERAGGTACCLAAGRNHGAISLAVLSLFKSRAAFPAALT